MDNEILIKLGNETDNIGNNSDGCDIHLKKIN